MPSTPRRLCARAACGTIVAQGYCASCAAQGHGQDIRASSAQRGYGWRWQKASKAFLQRHPLAVDYFGEHGARVFKAEVVDHIVPHRGDMKLFWDVTNWQGLTVADHNRKTALEDGGFGHIRRARKG